MRPLTLSRLLLQCVILGAILFCVMVLALKFGAVHVSLYGLGRDLLRVFLGKSTEISSEYSLILNIRLPRILLGVLVGASLSVAGTSFRSRRKLRPYSRPSEDSLERQLPSPRSIFWAVAKAELTAVRYCSVESSPPPCSRPLSFCCSPRCPAAMFAAWRTGSWVNSPPYHPGRLAGYFASGF